MTRDDIIRMAREAGFRDPNPHDGCMGLAFDFRDGVDTGASLERFAALVAAVEREACAKVCDAERSAFMPESAKNNGRESDFAFGSVNSSERIASAIRARSTP